MAKKLMKSPLEMILILLLIFYIILPIDLPAPLQQFIASPIGMVILLGLIVASFIYTSPIVGVLFVFAAFMLLHRIGGGSGWDNSGSYNDNAIYQKNPVPTQAQRDAEMAEMNPPTEITLEEEIVVKMARPPASAGGMESFVETPYLPVASNIYGASTI